MFLSRTRVCGRLNLKCKDGEITDLPGDYRVTDEALLAETT